MQWCNATVWFSRVLCGLPILWTSNSTMLIQSLDHWIGLVMFGLNSFGFAINLRTGNKNHWFDGPFFFLWLYRSGVLCYYETRCPKPYGEPWCPNWFVLAKMLETLQRENACCRPWITEVADQEQSENHHRTLLFDRHRTSISENPCTPVVFLRFRLGTLEVRHLRERDPRDHSPRWFGHHVRLLPGSKTWRSWGSRSNSTWTRAMEDEEIHDLRNSV